MKLKTSIAIFALTAKMAFAQNGWISAGTPYTTLQINCLFNDTISDRLYAAGQVLNPSFSKLAILYYDGVTWNNIGNADNQTRGITRFNNDIIVSGFFSKINGVDVNNIARYDGTNWYSFGNFNGFVWNVKVLNDTLYAMGAFSMVDSLLCNGIAKWTGSSWKPVFSFPYVGAYVYDAEIYQGDLYLGGNSFYIGTTDYNDIVVYKNGAWQMVGNGILGGTSFVDKLLAYKNELIIAGIIWRSASNTGDGIQKWNGSSWSDLGMGLRTGTNPNNSAPHVHDMKIHNNELYVAGVFDYADSLYAKHLAKWDGEKWCNFPTQDFIATNLVVDIYHDTIFTGCGYDTLNSDTINYLAKMLSLQPLGCRVTGIDEKQNNEAEGMVVYPNPANEYLNFLHFESNSTIIVTDMAGQLIIKTNLGSNQKLDISNLSSGIYFIRVQSSKNVQTLKLLKQ
ncbi:MAG: T9SS type A sorting domain-containing protein [Bacteroidia bacterium]|nr:T9SS type A sorting domain-containing protein [Bacteroidia bacterium]MCZ2356112.1 T9SS type A sorting domain-containing protein [Bacteroidia bacterium]